VTSFELRPLALGELLDRAFTLYRRYFTLFVGIMAVPSVISLAFVLFLTAIGGLQPIDPNHPPDFEKLMPILIGMGIGYVVFMFVYWIVYMLALGATTLAVADVYAGRPVTIRTAYARVAGQVGRLFLLTVLALVRVLAPLFGVSIVTALLVAATRTVPVLVGIVVFVSVLAVFAAMGWAFYLSLKYAVSVPALVLEHATASNAIRRSIALTRGYLGRVFLLVLCAIVLVYASAAIFQGPFIAGSLIVGQGTPMSFALTLIGSVSGTIGATLTAPLMIIGFAVLYYDLRIRKEALDLQLMIGALDAVSGGAPTPPPAPAGLPGLPEP
jgi:hypothetical protein